MDEVEEVLKVFVDVVVVLPQTPKCTAEARRHHFFASSMVEKLMRLGDVQQALYNPIVPLMGNYLRIR